MTFNEDGSPMKNERLLELNPKGTVPTLEVNNEAVLESLGTVQYLSDHFGGGLVFASPDLMKASQLIDSTVCSLFFRVLLAEERNEQAWKDLLNGLKDFADNVHED